MHSDPIRFDQLSVVVPVYNEGPSVRSIVLRALALGDGIEVVVVNDASSDNTAAELQGLPIRLINHARNLGYGASLKSGILAASRDTVITIDADGEHAPEDALRLLAVFKEGAMVSGCRKAGIDRGFVKCVGKMILWGVASFASSVRIPDINSGLRVFSRKMVVPFFRFFPDTFSFQTTSTLSVLLSRGQIIYVPINFFPRVGTSKVMLKDGFISLWYILGLFARMRLLRFCVFMAIIVIGISAMAAILMASSLWVKLSWAVGMMALGLVLEVASRDRLAGAQVTVKD
ncbi:MAG: glycosyltransferase family 2 protein [Candidatus Omnitrophica bacterium]|nr:glycosyltransferase family 2 protein [Candidatus Omnitrophota bacterium]